MQAQQGDGLEILEALEKRKPSDILISEYRNLLEHFQHWHNCNSPLAVRAKKVLRLAHPHLEKEFGE